MHAVDLVSSCIVYWLLLLYRTITITMIIFHSMVITYGLLICMHEEEVVMKRLLYYTVRTR